MWMRSATGGTYTLPDQKAEVSAQWLNRGGHARPMAVLLSAVALLLGVNSCSANAGANGQCIKPRQVNAGQGKAPDGRFWRAEATVRTNGSCDQWLFGLEFRLPGVSRWASASGIPRGSHLSPRFRLNAADQSGSSSAALSGLVGTSVGEIQASLADGTTLSIRPRLPAKSLRRRFVWLRGVSYFVRYHSVENRIVSLAAFDREGRLLYRVPGEDGQFF